ncbi:MAG: hypothetical protein HY705_00245 [Gemmatimonadetes bacterium]|nr:hypothetical protein [Gemmatimonadota bacterium]
MPDAVAAESIALQGALAGRSAAREVQAEIEAAIEGRHEVEALLRLTRG